MELVISPASRLRIDNYLQAPSQGLLLVGAKGFGKTALVAYIAGRLMDIPEEEVELSPYIKVIRCQDDTSLGIDAVRSFESFMALKVPSRALINRVLVIEDAHLLTVPAQNAFLKLLEEPPEGTVFILAAKESKWLLPTVRSRVQSVQLTAPGRTELSTYYTQGGYAQADIDKAYFMSGGLPGLMHGLLSTDDHPLKIAAEYTRKLLRSSLYERLVLIDNLSKDKQLAIDSCYILQQMAHVSLGSHQTSAAAQRWLTILSVSYDTSLLLAGSTQLKLVLTNLMLNLP